MLWKIYRQCYKFLSFSKKYFFLKFLSSLRIEDIIKTNSFKMSNQSLLSFTSQWNFHFSIISFSLLLFHDPGTIIQTFYQLRLTFYFLWHFYFSIYNLLSPLLKEVIFTSTFPRHFHFSMAPSLVMKFRVKHVVLKLWINRSKFNSTFHILQTFVKH